MEALRPTALGTVLSEASRFAKRKDQNVFVIGPRTDAEVDRGGLGMGGMRRKRGGALSRASSSF